MKLLTRAEEFVLLAIWRLGDEAYSVRIRKEILVISGEDWSLGTIYAPLDRLEKRQYVSSDLSGGTPERGGRPKRVYRLTAVGRGALLRVKAVQESFWSGVPDQPEEVSS